MFQLEYTVMLSYKFKVRIYFYNKVALYYTAT